jgi:hypothetical protein
MHTQKAGPGKIDAGGFEAAREELGGAEAGVGEVLDEAEHVVVAEGAETFHVGHVLGLRDAGGATVEHRRARALILNVAHSVASKGGDAAGVEKVLCLVALIEHNQRPSLASVALHIATWASNQHKIFSDILSTLTHNGFLYSRIGTYSAIDTNQNIVTCSTHAQHPHVLQYPSLQQEVLEEAFAH